MPGSAKAVSKMKSSKPDKPAAAARPGVPKEAAEAFAQARAEIGALDRAALVAINLDIPRAVAIAVAAIPHIAAQRPHIVEQLPKLDLRSVDKLGTYALAAWYAHLLALPTTTEAELAALLKEATPLREALLVAAEALAHKGLLDAKSVADIRAGQGNLDKANDLVALAALFSAAWPRVGQRTAIEQSEVERAAELGPAILVALGAREPLGVDVPDPSEPAEQRKRAFTLFYRAYEECRRAVSYLRWHEGDAESIAPSLHLIRNTRPASDAPENPTDVPAPPVDAPAAPGRPG